MKHIASLFYISALIFNVASAQDEVQEESSNRNGKVLSVFNVVTFPNSACGATNGYNGTCYTTSECESKGGTASGTCASSFGVCCVFSLSCGGSSSANNSYAIISSYSTSNDADPCTYTFCKTNTDVCKLRIDFDTMVLSDPETLSSTIVTTDGVKLGSCMTDSLTVSNPGGQVPPTICGYNTGQHMWVPASDQCNQINIDIDTGSTGTTRKWQIKVTQYECGNMMAPEQNCLQYHTAASGTIASFHYDTSASTVGTSQVHLANQYYDICIRRKRSYCALCLSPKIAGTGTTAATSFGLGAGSAGPAQTASVGATCTGVTTVSATEGNQVGYGDYLEIAALHAPPFSSTTIKGVQRICGSFWNAATTAGTTHATACTYATPFKIGVHMDGEEAIKPPPDAASPELDHPENAPISGGSGRGFQGFWLNYWQTAC